MERLAHIPMLPHPACSDGQNGGAPPPDRGRARSTRAGPRRTVECTDPGAGMRAINRHLFVRISVAACVLAVAAAVVGCSSSTDEDKAGVETRDEPVEL